MIDTLRLARRWKEAQNDPERMVEALADELDRETVGKTDLRELEARILARLDVFQAGFDSLKTGMQSEFEGFKAEMRGEFEAFKAEVKSDMARFRNQVLSGQLAMFIALVTLIIYRTA